MLIALVFAIPMALLAARRPSGVFDRLAMVFSMGRLSIANYVLALSCCLLFAVKLNSLPALGFVPPDHRFGDNIKYLMLPAVAIALSLMCFYTRQLRADLLQQMHGEDYIATARAKGAGRGAVILRHALRNSLFGLITTMALNFGTLLGATVIIEQIFALPGHRPRAALGDQPPRHAAHRGSRLHLRADRHPGQSARRSALRRARPPHPLWR